MEPWIEEHKRKIEEVTALEASKHQAINDSLPSWSQVESYLDGLDSMAEVKIALKRIARVVYWLAWNKGD